MGDFIMKFKYLSIALLLGISMSHAADESKKDSSPSPADLEIAHIVSQQGVRTHSPFSLGGAPIRVAGSPSLFERAKSYLGRRNASVSVYVYVS